MYSFWRKKKYSIHCCAEAMKASIFPTKANVISSPIACHFGEP